MKEILRRKSYKEIVVKTEEHIYDYNTFILNTEKMSVVIDGAMVDVTARKYELLLFFCKNPNKIFTTSQLHEAVWKAISFGDEKD